MERSLHRETAAVGLSDEARKALEEPALAVASQAKVAREPNTASNAVREPGTRK